MSAYKDIAWNGIWKQNTILAQMLGLCPLLAVSSNLGFDTVPQKKWKVKKDGGRFDQMSGATISARAVTNASGRALAWAVEHRDKLFALPANSRFEESKP